MKTFNNLNLHDEYVREEMKLNTKICIYKIINKNVVEIYISKLNMFKKAYIYHPKFEYLIENDIKFKEEINQIKVGKIMEIDIGFRPNPIPKRKIVPIYLIHPNIV